MLKTGEKQPWGSLCIGFCGGLSNCVFLACHIMWSCLSLKFWIFLAPWMGQRENGETESAINFTQAKSTTSLQEYFNLASCTWLFLITWSNSQASMANWSLSQVGFPQASWTLMFGDGNRRKSFQFFTVFYSLKTPADLTSYINGVYWVKWCVITKEMSFFHKRLICLKWYLIHLCSISLISPRCSRPWHQRAITFKVITVKMNK